MAKRVLVTGASGYLATHLIEDLLERGYHVRGTVRSLSDKSKYAHLLTLRFATGGLELVEADVMDAPSILRAMAGCVDGVFHVASPYFRPKPNTPASEAEAQLLRPALEGTRNVLQACAVVRPKRIVVTGSAAAVMVGDGTAPSRALNENDWNERSSLTKLPYPYSKVRAERETWRLASELSLDVVVVNPTLILGPVIAAERVRAKGWNELNTSCKTIGDILRGTHKGPATHREGYSVIDVKDVVKAHRLALELPSAKGRYITSSVEPVSWAQMYKWLREEFPQFRDRIPDPDTNAKDTPDPTYSTFTKFDSTKALSLPGFETGFIHPKDSIIATAQSLLDNNLLDLPLTVSSKL
eukprot:PhF_6_TR41284/c1_g1_i8/m.62454